MLKKILKSGLLKALPLSSIIEEVGETVKEIKEQNNYKRLIKLAVYVVVGGMLWFLIIRGLATTDQILEIIKALK